MCSSDQERDEATPTDGNGQVGHTRFDPSENQEVDADMGWLNEIVAQLDEDPSECWLAMESLAALDEGMRRAIIAELSNHRTKAGVRTLLRLLSTASDPGTRAAARLASHEAERPCAGASLGALVSDPGNGATSGDQPDRSLMVPSGVELRVYSQRETSALELLGIRIVRGLVTPVDGQGRGMIVVSSSQLGQRRTAVFCCDVQKGILDVVGEVEADSPTAGRLVEEWIDQTGEECACDVPELAVRLLGGSLLLAGAATPRPVRDWVDGMLGNSFQPSGLLGTIPDLDTSSFSEAEMSARAHAVLDACPSWLDQSALTFELADEISLREGALSPDPVRDAGAYRFLFEHLLIHRLEMYRRMLLWMAWVWQGSGRPELSESAFVLACQLSDEQYEVPSHPFTVALSTRSLEAAQDVLRTAEES
jgi:hypothetical protein